jgi:hypothetical protein
VVKRAEAHGLDMAPSSAQAVAALTLPTTPSSAT